MRRLRAPHPVHVAPLLAAGLAVAVCGQLRIERLNGADPVYSQHQWMVAEFHQAHASGDPPPDLMLLSYAPQDDETLYTIAAALMLPYSAIATLNRMDSSVLPDGPLLVPNQPGLFAWDDPRNDLERSVTQRLGASSGGLAITVPLGERRLAARFVPGSDFSREERDRFLRVRFAHPLPGSDVTSPFGFRSHPVTGIWSFHHGADFSGSFGDPVLAAADGIVRAIGRDPWLGLSISIEHRGGYETRYAHLEQSIVAVGDEIAGGDIVGMIGSTGLSTGPHLHFEVRYRGDSRNPLLFLPGVSR